MHVSVIGGGYVGLVTGTCLAYCGHHVNIIDLDAEKVRSINNKTPPIYEEGLTELLQSLVGNHLLASTGYESVYQADIVIISVGTPQGDDGSADLSYIQSASEAIGTALYGKDKFCVVAMKSTVPPGTTSNLVKPIVISSSHRDTQTLGFVMNPEFLREGRAIHDFLHPDRIVIGADDERSRNVFLELYRNLDVPKIHTSLTEAEMIKYTSNAFLATKISFSNEIGNVCKRLGLDVYHVMEGVGHDTRIGPHFLDAGAGFGGSCFPKDITALMNLAEKIGEDPIILKAVMEVNHKQPERMIDLLRKHLGDLKGKRVAVLGLAFKDNTDDIRESRSIVVIRKLLSEGADVAGYDPMATDQMRKIFPEIEYSSDAASALLSADGALIMTEWPQFRNLSDEFSLMRNKVVIDGRHLISGPGIEGICW